MKKFLLSYVCLLTLSTTLAHGTTEWESLDAYYSDMDKQGKPRILIVGCGHIHHKDVYGNPFLEGNHTHEDAWCVDISDPTKYAPKTYGPKNPTSSEKALEEPKYTNYVKYTGANQEFDITLKYGNNLKKDFDVVVLERNYEATLSNPRTLYNATRMLKPDGHLWVDINRSYSLDYTKEQINIVPLKGWVAGEASEDEATIQTISTLEWLENFYSHSWPKKWNDCLKNLKETYGSDEKSYTAAVNQFDVLRKTLPEYGIKYEVTKEENPEIERINKGLLSMGTYLAMWYYTDIIIADNAIQPYCKRKGQFLVAKKTKFTKQQESSWLESIQAFEKNSIKK